MKNETNLYHNYLLFKLSFIVFSFLDFSSELALEKKNFKDFYVKHNSKIQVLWFNECIKFSKVRMLMIRFTNTIFLRGTFFKVNYLSSAASCANNDVHKLQNMITYANSMPTVLPYSSYNCLSWNILPPKYKELSFNYINTQSFLLLLAGGNAHIICGSSMQMKSILYLKYH